MTDKIKELKEQLKRKESECEELVKYLIDIFKALGIDTSQSLLGSNCIEFYAVRSDTAESKIKQYKQEIKELKEWQQANQPTGICETCTAKSVEDMYKYKQALDEVEYVCRNLLDDDYMRNVAESILNIINKMEEN